VSDTPHSIADLLASGVVLEWHEAVAIMQGLCLAINASPDSTTEAKLTLDQVFVDPGGTIRLGVRPGQELEAPGAVEIESVEVRHAVHRHAADARHGGVDPRVFHVQDCRTAGVGWATGRRGITSHPPIAAATARTAPSPNTAACPAVL